jgi:hypothetical protein
MFCKQVLNYTKPAKCIFYVPSLSSRTMAVYTFLFLEEENPEGFDDNRKNPTWNASSSETLGQNKNRSVLGIFLVYYA